MCQSISQPDDVVDRIHDVGRRLSAKTCVLAGSVQGAEDLLEIAYTEEDRGRTFEVVVLEDAGVVPKEGCPEGVLGYAICFGEIVCLAFEGEGKFSGQCGVEMVISFAGTMP